MFKHDWREALHRLNHGPEDAVEVFDRQTGQRLYLIREEDLIQLFELAGVEWKRTTRAAA